MNSPRRQQSLICRHFNDRASKYMKQKLTEVQGETDESTISVGDFNTPYENLTYPAGRLSARKEMNSLSHTSIKRSTFTMLQLWHNKNSLQVHMEYH